MVLTQCPACDQNVLAKADICPHCDLSLSEVDEARVIEQRRRKLRDRIYHYRMGSYLALALLIAAFGWFLIESDNLMSLTRPSPGPYILFTAGAVFYLIIRVFIFKSKLALRKLLTR